MKIIISTLLFLLTQQAFATHLLGGYISYAQRGNSSTVDITVHLLIDATAWVNGGQGLLEFGDGTSQSGGFDISIEPLKDGVDLYRFTVPHNYDFAVNITYLIPRSVTTQRSIT